MAAQQICQVGACASVWDVDQRDTGHAGKEFPRDVALSSPSLSAHFAPRNGVELTLYGLAVTVIAFTLTLWALPA